MHCLDGSDECVGGIGCVRRDYEQAYRPYLLAGLVANPLVVRAWWLSIVFQIRLFSLVRDFTARTVTILTWGGLRGGVSVAQALSPVWSFRDALVTITYAVVVFSILVQGLTINRALGSAA